MYAYIFNDCSGVCVCVCAMCTLDRSVLFSLSHFSNSVNNNNDQVLMECTDKKQKQQKIVYILIALASVDSFFFLLCMFHARLFSLKLTSLYLFLFFRLNVNFDVSVCLCWMYCFIQYLYRVHGLLIGYGGSFENLH